jgi:hypothetical protein
MPDCGSPPCEISPGAGIPFIKEKIPTFIDKPFCYRAAEGQRIPAARTENGHSGYLIQLHCPQCCHIRFKEQVKNMEGISQVICTGPADFDSPYGGIFFYGVHISFSR